MPRLKIVTYPNRILRTKAREVKDINEDIVKLANDMLNVMYEAPGIGLAANQVGALWRVIVFDVDYPNEGGHKNPQVIINPVILGYEGEDLEEEGCLSIPGVKEKVKRHAVIEVGGFDINGRELRFEADGLLARVIQHEVDHLDGILFIDRLSKLKRELIKKRIKKGVTV